MSVDGRPHIPPFYEINIMGQLRGCLSNRGIEAWSQYNAYDEQFPSDIEMQHLKAIVIPGSATSAYEELPWIAATCRFI